MFIGVNTDVQLAQTPPVSDCLKMLVVSTCTCRASESDKWDNTITRGASTLNPHTSHTFYIALIACDSHASYILL